MLIDPPGRARTRRILALAAIAGLALPLAAEGARVEQPVGIPVPQPQGTPPGKGPGVIEPGAPVRPGNGGVPQAPPKSGAEYDRATGRIIGNNFHFGPYAEGIEVKFLVELIVSQAGLKNVIVTDRGVIDKKVTFSDEIVIPVNRLVEFLETILTRSGATISKDGDLLFISGRDEIEPIIAENQRLATTQVIPTRGLRPSSLQQAIAIALRGSSPAGAQPGVPVQLGGGSIAYLDDLGVILMTDTPRRIAQVRATVQLLVDEQSKQDIERFELQHIAAAAAKQRLFDLLGSGASGSGRPTDPQQAALQAAQQAAGMGGASQQALSNIAGRLVPDPKSNVLIFRGRPDETDFIRRLLAVIDTPNQLVGRFYRVGLQSEQLATFGRREGLGEVVTLPGGTAAAAGAFPGSRRPTEIVQPGALQGSAREATEGGPVFVLDPDGRGFMYFGTHAQHERVAALAKTFEDFVTRSTPVFEFYKLKHTKAADIAQVINSLISNQVPSGSLLGSSRRDRSRSSAGADTTGRGARTRDDPSRFSTSQPSFGAAQPGAQGLNDPLNEEIGGLRASEDVFVLGDEANNQIVVKAPKPLQPQFAKIIQRLDLRRPQVYIDAKIIAVTDNDTFRLAFETQIISLGGDAGFGLNTNFGLGSIPAATGTPPTGGFLSPKTVATGLGGLTAAIIRSDQVPVIINAIASKTDARILSTPQLLVDDNFEAEISSINRVPTSATTVSNNTTLTTSGPDAEAGTRLNVTPRISEGGYLNLAYDIELSSFTGPTTTTGGVTLPPPSQRNTIYADSVTLPSDSTVVIGGLTFENVNSSVMKIPFLGDIPILGQLFRDENKTGQRTTLYVFITPRIMTDPNFLDLKLLTEGPAKSLLDDERSDIPITLPSRIELKPIFPAPEYPPRER